MDENNTMAANAEFEAAQTASAGAEAASASEDSAAAVETSQTEDITQTQAFSRRLNEMSEKRAREAVDSFVASLGQTNPYTGEPIRTEQDMRNFRAMQEADEQGKDPETAVRIRSLEGELAEYRLREQETALRNDPELGALFEEYYDDVADLVNYAAENGREVSLEDALRHVMAYNMDAIRKSDAEKARQETIRQINANSAASPGSVSGAAVDGTVDYSRMSDEDFEKAIAAAKRGEMRS